MKSFEIWTEGYVATGEHGRAVKHGEMIAETFEDACDAFARSHPEFGSLFSKTMGRDGKLRLSMWGCRLFDNEQEARQSFG